MLAIFKTGGKQYSVKTGQVLKVEKLEGKKGDNISFKDVLAISESSNLTFGSPLIEGAEIQAKILDQIRNKKIIVFKKRRRQNYRSTQGHRQYLTVLKIESISVNGTKAKKSTKESEKQQKVTNYQDKKTTTNKTKKVVQKKMSSVKKTVKKSITKKTTKKTTVKKVVK